MKKLWKQNFWLLAALGAYALVSLYVYERSGIFIHRAIVWNVFLALLPYLFMTLFFCGTAASSSPWYAGCLSLLAAAVSQCTVSDYGFYTYLTADLLYLSGNRKCLCP